MGLAALIQILWSMNSCINPLVYASTIPDFKDLIRRVLSCNSSDNDEHKSGQESKSMSDKRENTTQSTQNKV